MKVGDKYRINPLSFKEGGFTVVVENHNGSIFEYDKIKNPESYIRAALRNPIVKKAWVKENKK